MHIFSRIYGRGDSMGKRVESRNLNAQTKFHLASWLIRRIIATKESIFELYETSNGISMVSGYWIDDDFILFYAIFRIKRRKNIFPRDDPWFFFGKIIISANRFEAEISIDSRTSVLTKWLKKIRKLWKSWSKLLLDPPFFYFTGIYI